jgi:peptide/nickel transport system permease protein
MAEIGQRRRQRERRHHVGRGVLIGVGIILLLFIGSLISPLPHSATTPNTSHVLEGPGTEFWFGTDTVGTDIFSRTIRAARVDLALALAGTALSLLVGVPLGLLTSVRGRLGEIVARGLDAFQALPLIVLALAIVSLSGNRIEMVVVAIALISIPRFMRLIRSAMLTLREARFVEAAVATGASWPRIMRRNLLPNIRSAIVAETSLTAAYALVVIAALSFLGIGVQPPTPSWGAMIRDGSPHMVSGEWWLVVFPGIALFLSVFSFNLVADGIEDMGR